MKENELSSLTDQELLEKAKSIKSTPIVDAVFIGAMMGIVIYSVVKSTLGFFTLIPLFFIHQLLRKSKNNDALNKLLKERNLK